MCCTCDWLCACYQHSNSSDSLKVYVSYSTLFFSSSSFLPQTCLHVSSTTLFLCLFLMLTWHNIGSKVWSLRIWLCNKAQVSQAEETISSQFYFSSQLTRNGRGEGRWKTSTEDEEQPEEGSWRAEQRWWDERRMADQEQGEFLLPFAGEDVQQFQRQPESIALLHVAASCCIFLSGSILQLDLLSSLCSPIIRLPLLRHYRSNPEKSEQAAIGPQLHAHVNSVRGYHTNTHPTRSPNRLDDIGSLLEELIKPRRRRWDEPSDTEQDAGTERVQIVRPRANNEVAWINK